MSILSTEQLAETRKLCQAATKGAIPAIFLNAKDAAFVDFARDALPDALDTIEQLQRELATAKATIISMETTVVDLQGGMLWEVHKAALATAKIAAWREAAKAVCNKCDDGEQLLSGAVHKANIYDQTRGGYDAVRDTSDCDAVGIWELIAQAEQELKK